MTHKTKGIVLRAVKYGETSLVVTVLTEVFGVQTYMVNGVRTSKQASAKANYFQAATLLDMVVYHNDQKTMHRIKEFKFLHLYQHIFSDVIKNAIAVFMVEVLYKCLKQPETNTDLFNFCEDALMKLDEANKKITANFPLFFSLQLPQFFGFKMIDNYSEENNILDLAAGVFCDDKPTHLHFLDGTNAFNTAQLLKVMTPDELEHFNLNKDIRRLLLLKFQEYYGLHVQDFGQLKTLVVLHEVF